MVTPRPVDDETSLSRCHATASDLLGWLAVLQREADEFLRLPAEDQQRLGEARVCTVLGPLARATVHLNGFTISPSDGASLTGARVSLNLGRARYRELYAPNAHALVTHIAVTLCERLRELYTSVVGGDLDEPNALREFFTYAKDTLADLNPTRLNAELCEEAARATEPAGVVLPPWATKKHFSAQRLDLLRALWGKPKVSRRDLWVAVFGQDKKFKPGTLRGAARRLNTLLSDLFEERLIPDLYVVHKVKGEKNYWALSRAEDLDDFQDP